MAGAGENRRNVFYYLTRTTQEQGSQGEIARNKIDNRINKVAWMNQIRYTQWVKILSRGSFIISRL